MLKSKFHRPRLDPDIVNSQRLTKLFEDNAYKPVTLVCAPAGYGKNIALSRWLEKRMEKPVLVNLIWSLIKNADTGAGYMVHQRINGNGYSSVGQRLQLMIKYIF
jgi:ATP/maltotriose-dependent transcriptional regulator MalT